MRGGETLRYANLVRDIIPVGRWNGKAVKQRLQLQNTAQYDGVVVLLQAGTAGKAGRHSRRDARPSPRYAQRPASHRVRRRVSRTTRPTRHAVSRAG